MNKPLKEKLTLNEDEIEVLPSVELEEPIEVSTEESTLTDKELTSGAIEIAIGDAITNEWTSIDNLKSLITTISLEEPIDSQEEIVDIINSIIDEKTMIVGMLQKIVELTGGNTAELLDKGTNKAEEVIEKPEEEINEE